MDVIHHLTLLGERLGDISSDIDRGVENEYVVKAIATNGWFTESSVSQAIKALASSLQKEKIEKWLSAYSIHNFGKGKNIGVVMAGNIPLVGFHDLICVLASGNNITAKLSSKDKYLYSIVKQVLVDIDKTYEQRIIFTDGIFKNIDAVIATGSNNTSRYFEYYFGKYPNIIRKNRNSIAVLTGNESIEELQLLGNDIFIYFGLGCRNVSFLLVPENYDFENMFTALEKFSNIINHTKYANNYDYQKAILMMNRTEFFDTGFAIFKKDISLASPISVVHYSFYKNEKSVSDFIYFNQENIQCTVTNAQFLDDVYTLGQAQQPELWDYADNIDTMKFLLNL